MLTMSSEALTSLKAAKNTDDLLASDTLLLFEVDDSLPVAIKFPTSFEIDVPGTTNFICT